MIRAKPYARLRDLLAAIPESNHAVHGDFHMKNIMLAEGEPMLIDMDTLAVGDPIFDLQGVYVAYKAFVEDDPDNSQAFFGIDKAMSDLVWTRTLIEYFGSEKMDALSRVADRIRLVSAIRFLWLLSAAKGERDNLTQTRILHAQRHIDELLERVDSLRLV